MREIKFRLRDRHNKIVGYEKWYEGTWRFDNDQALAPASGYWVAQPCWLYSEDNKKWTPTYIPHRYKDPFTGLKDKDGKEIYEGDKVRHFDSFPGEQKLQIVWHGHGFYYAWKDGLINHKLMSTEFFEVIGNIYENPELLEAK